jgi:TPP-dependent pyruvate/acetoin dehydrogenase alpha subunit
MEPHSAARKEDSRAPEELAAWRARDPLTRFGRYLVDEAGVPAARVDELEAEARQSVAAAVEVALVSPRPSPGAELDDVYAPAEWLTPGRLS